jgi:hypothetical protein
MSDEEYEKATAALYRIANGAVDLMTERRITALRARAAASPAEASQIQCEIAALRKQALASSKEYQAALAAQQRAAAAQASSQDA